jgi:molybdopterin-guanine dinucleotide biosynthesis protein A
MSGPSHPQHTAAPLYGLVLAGGESSRMGRDKALLRYHGTSQVRYLVKLLSEYCARVFVSVGPDRSGSETAGGRTDSPQYARAGQDGYPARNGYDSQGDRLRRNAYAEGYAGLPVIRDRRTGIGPVAGLLAAAEAFPEAAWLAAAVDMPDIGPDQVWLLVSRRNPERHATVPYDAATGVFEPLFAIYEPEAIGAFIDAVKNGRYGLQRTLRSIEVERIPRAELGPLGNVNTPEEYRSYKEAGR